MDPNFDRWQGRVESELKTLREWCIRLKDAIDDLDDKERRLELDLKTITVKLAVFASLCGFIGGGLVSSLIAFYVSKK